MGIFSKITKSRPYPRPTTPQECSGTWGSVFLGAPQVNLMYRQAFVLQYLACIVFTFFLKIPETGPVALYTNEESETKRG